MSISLQVGKCYSFRNAPGYARVVYQLSNDPAHPLPYLVVHFDINGVYEGEYWHKVDGTYGCHHRLRDDDLIAEIPDPESLAGVQSTLNAAIAASASITTNKWYIVAKQAAMKPGDYELIAATKKKCECGSTSAGLLYHSAWCPMSGGVE